MTLLNFMEQMSESATLIINENEIKIVRYDGKNSIPNHLNNREVREANTNEAGEVVAELESVEGMAIGAYLEEFEIDTDTEVLVETIDGIPLQSGTAGELASEWRRRKISETDTDEERLVLRLGWGD